MGQRRIARILVLLGLIIAYGRYPRLIYGENCKGSCSVNCNQLGNNLSPCNCTTGECYEGCIPGYHGLACNLKCGNCLHNICNAHNGHCSDKCNYCYCGDHCNITCKTATCTKGTTTTPTPTQIPTPKPVSSSVLTGANIDHSRYISTSSVVTRSRTTFGTYSPASKTATTRDVSNPRSSTSFPTPTPVHDGHSIEIIGSIIAVSLMVVIVLMVFLLCQRRNLFPKRTERNNSQSQTNEETDIVDVSQSVARYYEINEEDMDGDETFHNIEHREMPYSVTVMNSVYEKLNSHSRANRESVEASVMCNADDDIIDPVDKYLDPVEI